LAVGHVTFGEKRTAELINHKPWYTWIYGTILQDEPKIATIVASEHLNVPGQH
jgi:hypothetical protein